MRQVLHISPLSSFKACDLRLEEVDAQPLFRTLGFEPVDLCGLRAELGLNHLALALAGYPLGLQATLRSLQLRFEVRRAQSCCRHCRRSNCGSVATTPVPVRATLGAEPVAPPRRFESGTALFAILLVHVDSSARLSGAT